MKKIYLFYPMLLLTLLLTSCSSIQEVINSYSVKSQNGDYKKMNISAKGIYQKPQVADLEIDQQRAKSTFSYEQTNSEDAKKLAKGDFMKQHKCDVIVEPLLFLTTTTNERGTNTSVTISGYPANYKNVRNYALSDSIYFKHYQNMPW